MYRQSTLSLFPESQKCRKCGHLRPLEAFEGRVTCCDCRARQREYRCRYRERHREEIRERRREHYAQHPEIYQEKRRRAREWQRTYNREYRAANRERLREKDREYRAANREKRRAKDRAWRERNRERKRATDRAYRKRNRERLQAYARAYFRCNRRKFAETERAYHRAHPEKMRERVRRRRARLRGARRVAVVTEAQVIAAYGERCYLCDAPLEAVPMHLDHVVPLARGGAHTLENLRPSCARCNLRKGAKTPEELLRDYPDMARRVRDAIKAADTARRHKVGTDERSRPGARGQ